MAEGVFLTAFGVGLVLQWMDVQTSILFIALFGLATIYFLGAYIPIDIPDNQEQGGFVKLFSQVIAPKVLGISSAVCVIGILFYLTGLKGYQQMLLIGCASIAAASVVIFFSILKNEPARKALMPLLLRAIPLAIISFYILMTQGLPN